LSWLVRPDSVALPAGPEFESHQKRISDCWKKKKTFLAVLVARLGPFGRESGFGGFLYSVSLLGFFLMKKRWGPFHTPGRVFFHSRRIVFGSLDPASCMPNMSGNHRSFVLPAAPATLGYLAPSQRISRQTRRTSLGTRPQQTPEQSIPAPPPSFLSPVNTFITGWLFLNQPP